ncbi:MAG: tyrosine-type recombinase/integrase, partial [Planctomycetaceae bacterium]|nr:tyrosine-type recombinase/integrase [Planctomycetaceae bacterium]
ANSATLACAFSHEIRESRPMGTFVTTTGTTTQNGPFQSRKCMPSGSVEKPSKPYPEFPLTAHANGQWCKKIRGKVIFFGVWSDPHAALAKYLNEREEWQAGQNPRPSRFNKTTTEDVVNLFLARCEERVRSGELSPVCCHDYRIIGENIICFLGGKTFPGLFRPADFASFRTAMADRYAPSRLSKIVAVTRMILNWAYESEIIEQMPRFGPDFRIAGNKIQRLHRAKQGVKLFSRNELKALLNVSDATWRAIILLGINGGLGNSDISRLTLSDVGREWLEFPRGKTGIDRRIPLWRETRDAISEVLRKRSHPQPIAAELLFLSRRGGPLIQVREDGRRTDLTIEGFRRLAQQAQIHRPRMGMYWLRHTFQTIGDEAKDPIATSAIMGHADRTMAGAYRERISDQRLKAVTGHVRSWLFEENK